MFTRIFSFLLRYSFRVFHGFVTFQVFAPHRFLDSYMRYPTFLACEYCTESEYDQDIWAQEGFWYESRNQENVESGQNLESEYLKRNDEKIPVKYIMNHMLTQGNLTRFSKTLLRKQRKVIELGTCSMPD
ncbi:hypothetical protein QYF36_025650 [Acer negundo]|nr:hypothetical protein QYF36_025650 [Acer negundo]